jgi:hypothetical protein
MKINQFSLCLLALGIMSCNQNKKETPALETYSNVQIVGAMIPQMLFLFKEYINKY